MASKNNRQQRRDLRRTRVRKEISGTQERPRLAVFRSARHIYAQVIDDQQGRTLAHASTLEKEVMAGQKKTGNAEAATAVGKAIAARLKKAGVDKVVFDRGGNLYHGRVKALAEGAREAGLNF